MIFRDWVDRQVAQSGKNRASVLQEMADSSGVSLTALGVAYRGARIGRYQIAKSISEATSGAVTIRELCEGGDLAK